MTKVWVVIFLSVLAWSGIAPKDRLIWGMEVAPAVIAFILLWCTRSRFPFTPLLYILILVHCIILMVGGHYTYAEVPLFDWIKNVFHLARNNYDKLGHFAQGFVPAMVAREIMMRNGVVKSQAWLSFLIVCICLAISAFYEIIEWWVALASEEAAEAFLGTQGYVWDTQSDMFYAMLGAVVALVFLSRVHNRQMARLGLLNNSRHPWA